MNRNEIIELASKKSEHCISIYIPTHQKGHQVKEGHDRLNLKNQIKEVEGKLQRKGLLENEINEYLKPVRNLLDDRTFWSNQKQGLGIFLGDNFFKTVSIPYEVEAHNVVNGRMHVKELMRQMEDNDNMYYILRLSQEKPILFMVANGGISRVACDMPKDISEVTKYYDVEKEPQSRPNNSSVTHASAPIEDREKEFVFEFFRKIDEAIRPAINTGGSYVPLVLVGYERMHAIYEDANTYPNLIAHQFTKNFDESSEKEIFDAVHPTMRLRFSENRNKKVEEYNSSQSQTVSEIADVVEAAYEGRIDTLFVGNGHRWGEFDKENYKVRTNRGDECLYNEAAYYTLKNGGKVFIDDAETVMGGKEEIAAILR
ncbi:hypothetical protein [Bernardetia sp.]|uniref:baeRF3 domain-containing protein n=1 Tax=Bernardetia sp. TaxID=1937974 RepID=UPI0025C0F620|nr:hypothetical protein [Bernardetia sp.]